MQIDNRKSAFYGWYVVNIAAGRARFEFNTVIYPTLAPEVLNWLNDRIGPSSRSTWVNGGITGMHRRILFRNKEQAALFKLTWA